MNTLVLTDIDQAAALLRSGGVVAFPTETVFGLGADATNAQAIQRLFNAKGRPSDNPLIVHLAARDHWPRVARSLPPIAARLLERFAPGPLTVVLPKQPAIQAAVTAGLDTVAMRIPAHSQARQLIELAGVPVAAPSANRSSRPSGTTWQSVLEDLDGLIDAVLCGDTCEVGIESTVVDCTTQPPRLLRPGAISLSRLQAIAPEIAIADRDSPQVNSPGLRHPHYQPQAELQIVENAQQLERLLVERFPGPDRERRLALCGYAGLDTTQLSHQLGLARQFASVESYARHFYEFLRGADRLGLQSIFCQAAPTGGLGDALNDRMRRAAAPR